MVKPEKKLINIEKVNSRIVLDIRYATTNNFVGKVVYDVACCFVHRDIAPKLDCVQKELEKQELGLKIYDGYRPVAVGKQFWEALPDLKFIAPPEVGSRHSRGTAVDVTLVDKQGKELAMPTEYDSFEEKAYADYHDLPKQVIHNRDLLQEVMVKHGFKIMATEWWHFDIQGYQLYPIIDTDFQTLLELN